ncbi:MAG: FAD-dependent oxidoreductase [Steroidobacteraceae bacterium]
MKTHYDIVIIGAGPAGQKAAIVAAEYGALTLVIDEQPSPGGQIFRSIENSPLVDAEVLGSQYLQGRKLASEFRNAAVDYVNGASVWDVTHSGDIFYSREGQSYQVHGKHLIIASGARERAFPISGWTLPGVMMAGAAQIMLKSSAAVADNAVFVGLGPLLYQVIHQYVSAGVPVAAIVDTTPMGNYLRALGKATGAIAGLEYLTKGIGWIHDIRAAKIPIYNGADGVELYGSERVEGIRFNSRGHRHTIATESVFLHQGVIPNVSLTQLLECEHYWSPLQKCWCVKTDEWCRTSVDGISVAGDGARIGGATAATASGAIAAIGALRALGRIDGPKQKSIAGQYLIVARRESKFRLFIDTLYQPPQSDRVPENGETLVCRCEEISAQAINDLIDMGCTAPNELKSYTRCGMGPCQGRFCGSTISEMIALRREMPLAEVGYFRLRPPLKPISLGEMAALSGDIDRSTVGFSGNLDSRPVVTPAKT